MTLTSSRSRRHLAATLLALGAAASTEAQGQQANTSLPLVPGARVRVTASTLVAPLIANYMQTRGDTAVFIEDAAGRGIWSIAIADIRKLERAEGDRLTNRPYMIRGAMFGGLGLGAAMYSYAAFASPSDSSRKYSRRNNALAGIAVGGLIGAFLGSRVATEKWTSVPLRQVSIVPSRRGVGIAIGF